MPSLPAARYRDTFTTDSLPPRELWPRMPSALNSLDYPERLNCADELLDGTIARHGADRPCLYSDQGRMWTYAELKDRVDRLAAVLVDLGVAPGNRVLLRGPNSPQLAACWLAVIKAGAVAVTTMPLLRAGELRAVIERAAVQYALCDERYVADLLLLACEPGFQVLTYSPAGGGLLGSLAAAKPPLFSSVPTAADDVALIAFTSGTSGVPKATMHFHRDVLAIADTFCARVLRPEPDDLFAGSPPLAFTYGLGGLLVFPLRTGASALMLERAAPPDLFAAVDRHSVTVLFTAPTSYRAFVRDPGHYRLSSLRRCVSAGESLPERIRQAFHDRTGLRIIDGLGSTEMLHIFISAAGEDIRPGTIGRAVPGFTVRILGPDGGEVPDGTPGRLAVQGPTGCRYLSDERQRDYVRDGWNITGDVCVRDADGYFRYVSRWDDMIVTSGYNVGAPEVEQAVLEHPAVAQCAVIGVPDEERGSVVKAFVVTAPGFEPSPGLAERIQRHVKSTIAPYKYPRLVEFVPHLPHSATGKVQRAPLRARVPGTGR